MSATPFAPQVAGNADRIDAHHSGHVIRALTLLHYASEYQLYGKDPLPGSIGTPGLSRLLSTTASGGEASPVFGPPASTTSGRSSPSEDLEVRKLSDAIRRFNSGLPRDHRGLATGGNGKRVVQSRTSNLVSTWRLDWRGREPC